MFRGATSLALDSKGRLAIPARYRNSLLDRCEGKMVVTVNNTQEHCLWLYPLDEWEIVEQKIVSLPSFDPQHQKLKRFLLGYATDLEPDANGRILISAPLRKFAMLSKSVFMVGQGNKFEIWSEELWVARRAQWLDEKPTMGHLSIEMERLAI